MIRLAASDPGSRHHVPPAAPSRLAIEGGAQGHGHRRCLLISSAWPEEFIEKIAEPCFKNVDFAIRDRHARGPIVDNAPSLNVVFDRAAKVRPRTRHDIKIGRQFAEYSAVARG
jgi:hypothetical protein